ncbi:hypothetical protein AB0395_16450 [Streptosporangium sp. NPDC051023]|uniref:hypothetical protein n=1 Tax=Streptosporangium sp. NPDC051023 TaxID=3155410 RepID=UPI00344B0B41
MYRFLLRALFFGAGAFLVIMLDLRVEGRPTADWLLPALSFTGIAVAAVGTAELRARRKAGKDDSPR